jgi:dephospho-CoA kinase
MNRKNNKVWALTGSIATGKSTASKYLSENYGIKILNADLVGHEILKKEAIVQSIAQAFGKEVIKDGAVDRQLLGKIVFSDRSKLVALNAIVHPELIKSAMSEIKILSQSGPVIFEAAILIEAGWHEHFEKIIITTCDPDIQIKRVMERNGLSVKETKERILSQISFEKKQNFADYIVDTTKGLDGCIETLTKIGREITS